MNEIYSFDEPYWRVLGNGRLIADNLTYKEAVRLAREEQRDYPDADIEVEEI